MSKESEVPVSFIVIAHDGSHQEQVFPSALKLNPLDRVLWHTNLESGKPAEEGHFRVTFDGPNPFDLTDIHGPLGGSTQIATVRADAVIGPYTYTVGLQPENGTKRRYDPEIIIEEAPADPPIHAATRTAGGGA